MSSSAAQPEMRPKVTTPQIRDRKGGPKLTMVTAYDYPSARIADEAGVDMILVGDSVANVVHGHETTLDIDLDTMVLHTAAVVRAKPRAMIIGDLPWLSYHVSVEDTIRNAGRLVREGGAEAVKLEGGRKRVAMVSALVDTEIPVMGHIGLTPQSVHAMGGYRVQGKMVEEARDLIADAHALEEAGIFALVLGGRAGPGGRNHHQGVVDSDDRNRRRSRNRRSGPGLPRRAGLDLRPSTAIRSPVCRPSWGSRQGDRRLSVGGRVGGLPQRLRDLPPRWRGGRRPPEGIPIRLRRRRSAAAGGLLAPPGRPPTCSTTVRRQPQPTTTATILDDLDDHHRRIDHDCGADHHLGGRQPRRATRHGRPGRLGNDHDHGRR